MPKTIDVRRLIGRRTYTTSEIARELGLHVQTVRSWKEAGMVAVDQSSHHKLYYGADVKKFYKQRQSRKQVKLGPGQFYCLHCKAGVLGRDVSEVDQGVKIGAGKRSIRLVGKCNSCGGKVQRFAVATLKVLAREKDINIDPQPSLFHSIESEKE